MRSKDGLREKLGRVLIPYPTFNLDMLFGMAAVLY